MLLVSLDAHGWPGSGAIAEGNVGYRALAAEVGGIGVDVSWFPVVGGEDIE